MSDEAEELELFERYRQMAVESILCFTSTIFSEEVINDSCVTWESL